MLTVISISNGSYGAGILNDIVSPMVLAPLKVVIFLVIFIVLTILLNIIANLSQVINKIPLISKANTSLGALLGLAEAAVTLLIICIVMRLLITMCGGSLVFINDATIDRTFIFKHLYSLDPLRLMNIE